MKNISIFVDESGDFGAYSHHSPYYIVTMVIHNQEKDISSNIEKLNHELTDINLPNHTIHTEPLIRREENYAFMSPNERRKIFSKLFFFTLSCDIQYKTFIFHKKEFDDVLKLEGKMAREISHFFNENLNFFQEFENVILYYDHGQNQLNHILNTVLAMTFTKYEFRRVSPAEYKLFQVADLICTLELLKEKISIQELSKSEQLIFHSKRDLKKDFLKGIQKKEFRK